MQIRQLKITLQKCISSRFSELLCLIESGLDGLLQWLENLSDSGCNFLPAHRDVRLLHLLEAILLSLEFQGKLQVNVFLLCIFNHHLI